MAMATYFFLSVFGSFVGLRELKLVEKKGLNFKWLFSKFKLAGDWLAARSSCLAGWFSTSSSQPNRLTHVFVGLQLGSAQV